MPPETTDPELKAKLGQLMSAAMCRAIEGDAVPKRQRTAALLQSLERTTTRGKTPLSVAAELIGLDMDGMQRLATQLDLPLAAVFQMRLTVAKDFAPYWHAKAPPELRIDESEDNDGGVFVVEWLSTPKRIKTLEHKEDFSDATSCGEHDNVRD